MGQYYKAYVREPGGQELVFSPHNAVFMAAHGLGSPDEIGRVGRSWDFDDPTSWGSLFSGFKLMEHSWLGNDFVSGVLEHIWDIPCHVAWVGDYADTLTDYDGRYTPDVYEFVWGETSADDSPFGDVPEPREDGYIVNLTKHVYVDLQMYREVATREACWSDRPVCVHPLPLLTAIGNGRGGGDYRGLNMDAVGSWAMDLIMYTHEFPSAFTSVDYARHAFVEGE